MSKACREWQRSLMDRPQFPTLGDLPLDEQDHLRVCRDCQEWLQYLQAEAEAWQALPVPSVAATAWKPALTRKTRSRIPRWSMALVGATLAVFLVWMIKSWQPFGPGAPTDDLIEAVEAATSLAPEDLFLEPLEQTPDYLEASGLWWTEEDLEALAQTTKPKNRPMGNTQGNAHETLRPSGRLIV